jgi:predicted nucleic acid-binding protein
MRVVIDTNVLVSWLISKGDTIQVLRHAWETGRFIMLVSDELIAELELTRFSGSSGISVQEAVRCAVLATMTLYFTRP